MLPSYRRLLAVTASVLTALGASACTLAAAEGDGSGASASSADDGYVGMISIEQGEQLSSAKDYGIQAGRYRTGITCKSRFYRDTTSCEILIPAAQQVDPRAIRFEGRTASALRAAFGQEVVEGDRWTLQCSDTTCLLDGKGKETFTVEWRGARAELASGGLSSADLQLLRREVVPVDAP